MKTAVILAMAAGFLNSPVVIQSEESKTVNGRVVFNRITLDSTADRDVWLMQQSHKGRSADFHSWDRVAIVVDKLKTPFVARYYELKPGELRLDAREQIGFLVSCYMCHANGPRVIRPDLSSREASLNWPDRVRIAYWNFKIRSYGRVDYSTDHDQLVESGAAFRSDAAIDNEPLTVRACTRCHTDSQQGRLVRQNALTMQFMIERGYMPPRGELSEKDRRALEEFAAGF